MSYFSPLTDVYKPKVNAVAQSFIDGLLEEQASLPEGFRLLNQVIEDAIDRVYSSGRIPGRHLPADVFKQKPIKLAQSVYLPTRLYPNFNFKGKILGPKGNTLKRLQHETMCKIAIKGRTSMRDSAREEKLRRSGNPMFNHLKKNLHVEIATVAAPAEAYARMANALSEIRKYIIPDKNDEISQQQYRELLQLNPDIAKKALPMQRSIFTKLLERKAGFSGMRTDIRVYNSAPVFEDNNIENAHLTLTSTRSFLEKTRELFSRPGQFKK